MDHRYGSRIPMQVVVLLYRGGKRLGEFKTRDISTHGAFLVTGEMDLHLGAIIEISFILTENMQDRYKVKGMLVRRTATGIGVIFADYSQQIMARLNTITQANARTGLSDHIKQGKMYRAVNDDNHGAVQTDSSYRQEWGDVRDADKVMIQADEILDRSARDAFIKAGRQANQSDVQAIIVDLAATRWIRASGVGMLLMLSGMGKRLNFQVLLVNCNPQVKSELASSRLLADLSIS